MYEILCLCKESASWQLVRSFSAFFVAGRCYHSCSSHTFSLLSDLKEFLQYGSIPMQSSHMKPNYAAYLSNNFPMVSHSSGLVFFLSKHLLPVITSYLTVLLHFNQTFWILCVNTCKHVGCYFLDPYLCSMIPLWLKMKDTESY